MAADGHTKNFQDLARSKVKKWSETIKNETKAGKIRG